MEEILDTPQELTPQKKYAGFWVRFAAWIIDMIVLSLTNALVSFLLLGSVVMNNEAVLENPDGFINKMYIYYGIELVIYWLYYAFQDSSVYQATLGKRALGLKVINEQGERLSFANATGRYFSTILSAFTLCIGYIMIAFDSRKQALHDKLASTFVVHTS